MHQRRQAIVLLSFMQKEALRLCPLPARLNGNIEFVDSN
jgi:hypothetical protein